MLGIIGRKAHVGGSVKSDVKALGSTEEVHSKLAELEYWKRVAEFPV